MVDTDSGCQKVLPGLLSQLTQCLSCEILEASTHLMFQGYKGLCFMAELILLTLPQRRWNNDLGPAGFEKTKQWLTNRQAQRFVRVHQGSLCLRSTSKYWYCRAVFHLNKMLSGLELCSGRLYLGKKCSIKWYPCLSQLFKTGSSQVFQAQLNSKFCWFKNFSFWVCFLLVNTRDYLCYIF